MKILIATDGSACSEKAIKEWCQISDDRQALEIRIISVYYPHTPVGTFSLTKQYREYFAEYTQTLQKRAEQSASDAAALIRKLLAGEPLSLTTSVIEGTADKSIIEEAENWHADLVVLGSHGYNFWERMMIGSVSDSVIHHALSSVLIVKEKSAGRNRR